MLIHVTAEHIRHGLREDPCNCPVALAVTEALGTQAEVGVTVLELPDRGRKKALLPPGVWTFIKDFDSAKVVRPFSFELDL
jgi:hypothetical protein